MKSRNSKEKTTRRQLRKKSVPKNRNEGILRPKISRNRKSKRNPMGNQMLKTLSFIGFSFSLIESLKIGIIRQPHFALPRACAGNGFEFVNRCLCTYSQWQIRHDTVLERGVANSKKFIYTNVKIDKSKRENQLYFQSCKTGKSLCSL